MNPITTFFKSKCSSRFWIETVALGILLFSFYLGFATLLTSSVTCSMFQDNTFLYHPILTHLGNVLRQGELPLWINTIGGGLSLYNNPQLSPLYPFYWIGADWFSSPTGAMADAHLNYLLHSLLLLVNTYVLLRTLKFHPIAAACGAGLFAISPEMSSYRFWINMIAPYSWMPLALAGIVQILQRKFLLGITVATTSTSLLTLASPSHPLIQAVYLCGIVATIGLVQALLKNGRHDFQQKVVAFGAVGILVALIAAPLIVSVLDFMSQSIRFVGAGTAIIGHQPIPDEAMTEGQYRLRHLARTIFPYPVNGAIGDSYLGASWLLLAVIVIFLRARSWLVRGLVLVAGYALLSATGSHTALFQINLLLPLINKIREPTHFFLFSTYAFATLAALCIESVLIRRESLRRWVIAWTAGLITIIATIWSAQRLGLPPVNYPDWSAVYMALGYCATTLLFARILPLRVAPLVITAPILFAAWNTTLYPSGCPQTSASDYFEQPNLESHAILKEISLLPDITNYRILFELKRPALAGQKWAMNASYYGIRSLEAYFNPLPAEQFATVWQAHGIPNYGLLLGVRYILCDDCSTARKAGYREIRTFKDLTLMEHEAAAPYAQIITHASGTYDHKDIFFNNITQKLPDTSSAYFPAGSNLPDGQGSTATVREQQRSYNSRTFTATSSTNAVFLLNEYLNSAWQVVVDGSPASIEPVNLNQMAIRIAPGTHTITFTYAPLTYLRLLVVQKITIVLALLALCIGYYKKLTATV